jgi:tRNA/rRNA methyltransferase
LLTSSECERLCIVLVRTRNPLNIGAAARAMSNFGFSHLRVVNPYEAAFREARSAVGASAVLASAREYSRVAEAVADCTLVVGTTAVRSRELHHPLKRLEAGAVVIGQELRHKELRRNQSPRTAPRSLPRVAILFGSEKTGLSNQALSHCHWLLRVPTSDQNISMNLGQAVAVCLYELVRGEKSPRPAQTKTNFRTEAGHSQRATSGAMDRLTELLLDAVRASGYLPSPASTPTREGLIPGRGNLSERAEIAEEKLRRLVRRLDLTAADAEIWMGILRQMAWKVRSTALHNLT